MAEQHNGPQERRPTRIIRRPEVTTRTGLSGSTIDSLEATGAFPRRVSIGPRSVCWIEAEVDAWIEYRVQEGRDAQAHEAARRRRDPNAWMRRVSSSATGGMRS